MVAAHIPRSRGLQRSGRGADDGAVEEVGGADTGGEMGRVADGGMGRRTRRCRKIYVVNLIMVLISVSLAAGRWVASVTH